MQMSWFPHSLPVSLNAGLVILVVAAAAVLIGGFAVVLAVRAARLRLLQLRRMLPADLFGQGLALNEPQPVSLSAMDRVYGPQIEADFPELNLAELKKRAERLALTTLEAIDTQDASLLGEKPPLYIAQLKRQLEQLQEENRQEPYRDLTVHRRALSHYEKKGGTCRIRFQFAISARTPGQEFRNHFKFEVEALYVQDAAHPDLQQIEALAVNCPNCGAPIPSLGEKVCPYCQSAIEPINNKVWTFSQYEIS